MSERVYDTYRVTTLYQPEFGPPAMRRITVLDWRAEHMELVGYRLHLVDAGSAQEARLLARKRRVEQERIAARLPLRLWRVTAEIKAWADAGVVQARTAKEAERLAAEAGVDLSYDDRIRDLRPVRYRAVPAEED
jgi:hypothetical protein